MAKRLNKNLVGGLTALAFVVITAAGVFMASELRRVDPEQYRREADAFADDGDYEKASIYYRRAFQVSDPPDPKYLVAVGNMKELNGDETKALQAWAQAAIIDPDLLEAHEKILDLYLPMRQWLRVKGTAEKILRLDEKSPKALHALGTALIQLADQPEGDRDRGFESLEQAHRIAPEIYDYAETLIGYYWSDAVTLAKTDPEQAARRSSDALNLAKDLVVKNQTPGKDASQARVLYARLLALPLSTPRETILASTLNEHLGGKDRRGEAENLFQQALEMVGEDPEVQSETLTALARYWHQRSAARGGSADETDQIEPSVSQEYLERAIDYARKAIDTWPTGFSAYQVLAQIYGNEREFEKAAQVCEERIKLPIDRKGLRANRQKALRVRLLLFAAEQYIALASSDVISAGDERLALTEKAEQLVMDARAEIPNPDRDGASLHILGKIKFVQGKALEALAWFEKADEAPGTPRWQNKRWLGILLFQQGQIGGAREALTEATRNPRADAQAWLVLAKVHLAFDDPEVAIIAANEALKRNPKLVDARGIKITANQRLGRTERVFQGLQELGERGEAAQAIYRAQLLHRDGKYQEAFEVLKTVLAEHPTSDRALRWLGAAAREIGKEREAFNVVRELADADPDNFNLRAQAIYLDPDLTDETREAALLAMIHEMPDDYTRAYRLGEFYRRAGDPTKATEQYAAAAQMIIDKKTDKARLAGPKGLLALLEKQFLLAVDQERWDEADAIVQTAMQHNVDGAHGMTFRGRAGLVRGRYDAAAEAFRLALEEQPSQAETWAWLGESHYRANRKTEARAAFIRAAEMNPKNFMAQRRLAEHAKSTGDLKQFNMRLNKCLQLNPDDAWVRMEELARREERNPEDGIARREALLKENPDDLANLVQLAHLYEITNNTDKASEIYAAALQHPDAPSGVAWRAAQMYADIEDRERAFRTLSEAAERAETKEDRAVFLLMAGTLHRRLGELAEAEQQFRKAVDLDPGENTFIRFADHYGTLRQHAKALEWWERAIAAADRADSPQAPRIRRARIDTLLRVNDLDAAAAAVREYRDLYPKDLQGHLIESELYAFSGQVNEAVTALTRYLQASPGNPSALYRRAQHNANRQRWQDAIADLEDLRAIDPDAVDYEPRMLLSLAYDRTDRSDLALSELKSLYEKHPKNDNICRQYFGYYMKHERYADAETLATALVNRQPDNPLWLRFLGQAAAELADGVKALANLRQAAAKSDYDWRYCATLLDACANPKFPNFASGIRFYEETLPADQRVAPVTYRYANLLARAGRTDEAVAAYRRALVGKTAARDELFVNEVAGNAAGAFGIAQALERFQSEPADGSLQRPNQHILAALLSNLRRFSEAMAILDSLASTSTDDVERASLHGRRGLVAERQGDHALAKQYYEEAIKYNPDSYFVLNNLAFLLTDRLNQPQEAVPYAERAVQINPQPTVMDTLAWTLVELREYGRAIGLLSAAVQRDPSFIAGLVHLGEAFRRSGDFSSSVPPFEQALKLLARNPNPEDLAYREQAEIGLQKARDNVAEP